MTLIYSQYGNKIPDPNHEEYEILEEIKEEGREKKARKRDED